MGKALGNLMTKKNLAGKMWLGLMEFQNQAPPGSDEIRRMDQVSEEILPLRVVEPSRFCLLIPTPYSSAISATAFKHGVDSKDLSPTD